LDRKCHRTLAGGLSCRCECAGELRSDTSRTRTHRLLPKPKSVLSWTIGSCRCQSARAIRRRVVSSNYWNRPSETQTTSATPLIHRCTVYRPCWYGSRYYSGADRRRMQSPKENPSDVSSSQTTNGSFAPEPDLPSESGFGPNSGTRCFSCRALKRQRASNDREAGCPPERRFP
jgi:hypothetical protein